jgi:hypothetical protein
MYYNHTHNVKGNIVKTGKGVKSMPHVAFSINDHHRRRAAVNLADFPGSQRKGQITRW